MNNHIKMKTIFSLIVLFVSIIYFAQVSDFGKNAKVGKVLHLKDADLYYEVYGKGEPLFLLHGNGGSIDAFTKEIPELSKHFKISRQRI